MGRFRKIKGHKTKDQVGAAVPVPRFIGQTIHLCSNCKTSSFAVTMEVRGQIKVVCPACDFVETLD